MGGSLRAETTPDERAVWLDFLCLASAGYGRFDCANRDALAVQLLISRELLDRAIKKFTEAKRLSIRYDKRERKEVFTIIKWAQYQAFPRSHHKKTGGDVPSPSSPSSKKRNKDREKEREREEAPKSAASFPHKAPKSAAFIALAPLPPIPKGLPFKTIEELENLRRRLEDLSSSPDSEQAEKLKKRYLKIISFYEK